MVFKLKKFNTDINVTRLANIHYFEFLNEYHTAADSHAFREIVYVDSGSVQVESDGYHGVLSENQLIMHKSRETHSLSCPKGSAPDVIIIGFECACEELDSFSSHPVTLTPDMQKILTDVVKEGRNVFMPPYDQPNVTDMKKRAEYPFGADQLIKSRLENLLIELIRYKRGHAVAHSDGTTDTKAAEICDYLKKNYREHTNLDELCFLYNTNKTTLCKSFKSAYGKTIVDYINELRIRDAKKMLRSGEYNISQIAFTLGFSSINYFSRLFRQYTRTSPSEYVKTIKSKLDSE